MHGIRRADVDKKLSIPLSSLVEDSKEVCRDYQRGSCPRGSQCPFRHVRPATPQGHPQQPRDSVPEICRDLTIRGLCPRGRDCPFIHPAQSKVHVQGSPTQEICRDYMRGECTRDRCPFLHTDSVVQVCRDYIRGECDRGSSCPYHHITSYRGVRAEPCKDFARGLCERGNSCPRAHVPEYVEICRNNLRGLCTKGSRCAFHHSDGGSNGVVSPMDTSDNRPIKRKREARESNSGGKKERESTKDLLDEELDVALRNRELLDENKTLREENSSLRSDNASLRLENTQLRESERASRRQDLSIG